MAGITYIIYTEQVVGKNHPTLADVDNRPLRSMLSLSGYDPDANPFGLLVLPGNLTWLTDNANDLGANGANRPRDLFLARDIVVGRHGTFAGNTALTEFSAGNSGTALTIDWNNGNNQLVTLTGNCTFTFNNPKAGAVYTLELTQDGVGTRTATWPAAVTWPGGTAPTLTTTINKSDIVTFKYNGTAAKYRGRTAGLN